MKANCEDCIYYFYDDEYECYSCEINLDEDEMFRFISSTFHDCPYYRFNNEYTIVKKQN